MRSFIILVALMFASLCSQSVLAADFQKGIDAYTRKDFLTASRELHPLAEQGFAAAQAQLAFMYINGEGVPRSQKTGFMWLSRAAKQGNSRAHFYLGLMYTQGEAVPQDFVRAYMWMKTSSLMLYSLPSNKQAEALSNVADLLSSPDLAIAESLVEECAKKKFLDC